MRANYQSGRPQPMNRFETHHRVATASLMASDDYLHAVADTFMTLDEGLLADTEAKRGALYDASMTGKTLVPIETASLCDESIEISIRIPQDPTDSFDEDDAERTKMVRLVLISDFNDVIRKADAETK